MSLEIKTRQECEFCGHTQNCWPDIRMANSVFVCDVCGEAQDVASEVAEKYAAKAYDGLVFLRTIER